MPRRGKGDSDLPANVASNELLALKIWNEVTCVSWLFSRALVEAFSEENSWDGEPCAQLNVTPTPHKFWHNGKTMDASNLSRFGLTCAVLTERLGADLLTWFREVFLAKIFPAPAKAKDSMASEADSGEKWHGSLAKYDRATCSWKTHQYSLLGDLDEFSETWPRWGLMHDGECWELPTFARHTSESESGLLPTLTVVSCKHPGRLKRKGTQQTSISMELAKRDSWKAGGKYSPSHAAWFMGWPESWTSLGRSVTDKFHAWQQAHGGF